MQGVLNYLRGFSFLLLDSLRDKSGLTASLVLKLIGNSQLDKCF